jgi:hypothetical protein
MKKIDFLFFLGAKFCLFIDWDHQNFILDDYVNLKELLIFGCNE